MLRDDDDDAMFKNISSSICNDHSKKKVLDNLPDSSCKGYDTLLLRMKYST